MAREWHLRGVSEEELRPDPRPIEQPKTPKSWLENFWYHYKAIVLGGGFSLIVLTVIIVSMVVRVHPDYTAVLLTDSALFPDEVARLEGIMAQYGEDINGDGEVVVTINNLCLGGIAGNNQNANAQALQLQLITGDTLLYLYEPAFEKRLTAVGHDQTYCLLAELPFSAEGVSEDKVSWNWSGNTHYKQDVMLARFSKDLRFGVRSAVPDNEKSAEKFAQVMRLLEAFATEQPTAK